MSQDESTDQRPPAPRAEHAISRRHPGRASKFCESIEDLGLDGLLGRRHRLGARLQEHQDEHLLGPPQRGAAVRPADAHGRRLRADPAGPGDPPSGRSVGPAEALSPGAGQAAALRRAGRAAGRQAGAGGGDPGQRPLPQPPDHRLGQAGGGRGVPGIGPVRRGARRRPGLPLRRLASAVTPRPPSPDDAPAAARTAAAGRSRPTSGSTSGSGTPTRGRSIRVRAPRVDHRRELRAVPPGAPAARADRGMTPRLASSARTIRRRTCAPGRIPEALA